MESSINTPWAHPRDADLLDDIRVSILLGFDQDGLSEGPFPDLLHLLILLHVSGTADSPASWVWRMRSKNIHVAAKAKMITKRDQLEALHYV